MTWAEMKKMTLQRMFAGRGMEPVTGALADGYLENMPGAANEGLQLLMAVGGLNKKTVTIRHSKDGSGTGDRVSALTDGVMRYDMTTIVPDFYTFDEKEIFLETEEGYGRTADYVIEGGNVLLLPGRLEGLWRIYYNPYPEKVTAATADSREIPLKPEAAVLLPLYMASQLFKEDDIGLAVQYRNEFEVGRESLLVAAYGHRYGKDAFLSATGWW